MLTIPTQIVRNCDYYSVGSLACITLLLLGSIPYYFYMANLSFDNSAYGQEQSVDDERPEDRSNDDTVTSGTPREEDDTSEDNQPPPQQVQPDSQEAHLTPQQVQPPPQQVQPPPQQVQPDSATSGTPREEDDTSEDNASDQSTGPVRFTFVDSFWTDYTSLGGVIASTSSESVTAQPLPPAIKQEVEPGEGEAVLAVVLRNRGFADATSISGSLDLPSGFRAIVTPEDVDSDTALASYNGLVNAGQTFTLYFRVEITQESEVGREYTGELKIRYFKVDEQEEEDTRSTTLDIPFRLSGRVILSTAAVMTSSSSISTQGTESILSHMVSANPGIVNPLKIEISNNGSAIATGVIVNVLPPGTVSSSNTQTGGDGTGSGLSSNNSAESTTTSGPAQQSISSSSSPATMVIVGSPTFNVGLIDANATKEIVPTIFPADTAAGTLTTLNIQILYNDAYGNKKTLNQVLGVQILPESPQSGLSVLPSSSTSLEAAPESSLLPLTRTSLGAPSTNSTTGQSDVGSNSSSSSSSSTNSSSSTEAQSIQIAA